jgi:hypothetical protein
MAIHWLQQASFSCDRTSNCNSCRESSPNMVPFLAWLHGVLQNNTPLLFAVSVRMEQLEGRLKRFINPHTQEECLSSEMLRRVALVRTDDSDDKNRWARNVSNNVVPSSLILVILMMEAISSSETPVPTRVTRRNTPEDDILHSQHRENLKCYIALNGWAL